MMIKIYVYSRSNGMFLFSDVGVIDDVIDGVNKNEDFTLTPPPDYDHVWRWIDDKWIADQPS